VQLGKQYTPPTALQLPHGLAPVGQSEKSKFVQVTAEIDRQPFVIPVQAHEVDCAIQSLYSRVEHTGEALQKPGVTVVEHLGVGQFAIGNTEQGADDVFMQPVFTAQKHSPVQLFISRAEHDVVVALVQ